MVCRVDCMGREPDSNIVSASLAAEASLRLGKSNASKLTPSYNPWLFLRAFPFRFLQLCNDGIRSECVMAIL